MKEIAKGRANLVAKANYSDNVIALNSEIANCMAKETELMESLMAKPIAKPMAYPMSYPIA